MDDISRRLERIILISGIIFLSAGIVMNPWVLEFCFSSDGELSVPNVRAIAVLNVTAMVMGIIFIALHKKNQKITAVLAGVLWSFMFLMIAEGIFFFVNRIKDSAVKITMSGSIIIPDSALGYRFRPDIRIASEKRIGNEIVYSVTYSMDSFGRRITPVSNAENRDRFLLFFGCSSTFGHGLNDNQTLPNYSAGEMLHYFPYNYGVEGYGAQSVLVKLRDKNLRNEIPQRSGIGLYIFTDNHIYRAIGCMEVYNMWGQNMPYFYLEDGRLIQKGNFSDGRPVLSTIYWLLGKSQVLRWFNVNFPTRISKRHIMLVQAMMKEMVQSFSENFPGSRFYIVIYPGTKDGLAVIPFLKQQGIHFLDYSGLYDVTDPQYKIPGDVHSSGSANQILARQLANDLSSPPDSD